MRPAPKTQKFNLSLAIEDRSDRHSCRTAGLQARSCSSRSACADASGPGGPRSGKTRSSRQSSASSTSWRGPPTARPRLHEAVLGALALGQLGQRLARDQGLEVLALLMIGERRLVAEDLVEEELLGLGERLMDLESFYARLALGLRQELAQDLDHVGNLGRLGFPESGNDQTIAHGMKIGHGLLPRVTMGPT